MYDLDFLKTQRREIRKDIKRYLTTFRDDIIEEYNLELPTRDEIKTMPKHEFDEWLVSKYAEFIKKENTDLELIEMIEMFICVENNILNLESLNNYIL